MADLSSLDNSKNKIYVSEHLLPYFSGLFYKMRVVRREGKARFAWCKGGKLFLRYLWWLSLVKTILIIISLILMEKVIIICLWNLNKTKKQKPEHILFSRNLPCETVSFRGACQSLRSTGGLAGPSWPLCLVLMRYAEEPRTLKNQTGLPSGQQS